MSRLGLCLLWASGVVIGAVAVSVTASEPPWVTRQAVGHVVLMGVIVAAVWPRR